MPNPFDTEDMAAGYATSRPPVHPLVIERAFRQMERTAPFPLALDVGCGAGISTRALSGFATRCIGLEPNQSMLRWAPTVAPLAEFLCGAAEAMPLRDNSIDWITAAGSLNYANLDLFFAEAARVLRPSGMLVVYDFSPGRRFRDLPGLDGWFSEFQAQYPPPPNEGRDLSPSILRDLGRGFRMRTGQQFEIGIPMSSKFYVDYMMTETNVAAAIRRGVPAPEIMSWCAATLEAVWGSAGREVLFDGYCACLEVLNHTNR